jgi:hypothetical protein
LKAVGGTVEVWIESGTDGMWIPSKMLAWDLDDQGANPSSDTIRSDRDGLLRKGLGRPFLCLEFSRSLRLRGGAISKPGCFVLALLFRRGSTKVLAGDYGGA